MLIKQDVSLKEYTTLKIGGIAKKMYFPETLDELKISLAEQTGSKIYLLSGGSNLLINDKKTFEQVINMTRLEKICQFEETSHIFEFSASVKSQEMIKYMMKRGYGGIEYLYNLPACLGGMIAMNAGKGKGEIDYAISDYLIDVVVLCKGETRLMTKADLQFGYRKSIFLTNQELIIVSARFKFEQKSQTEIEGGIKAKIRLTKEKQDTKTANAGSVFCSGHVGPIFRAYKKNQFGFKNGLHFSRQTLNWLSNEGQGTYNQAKLIINLSKIIHLLFGRKLELEWEVWE